MDSALPSTTKVNAKKMDVHTSTNALHMDAPGPIPLPSVPMQKVDLLRNTLKGLPEEIVPATPINVTRLTTYLQGYPPTLKQYLIEGFSTGFRLLNFSFTPSDKDKNLHTANEHPHVVDKKLYKELTADRIMGPFLSPPYQDSVISPLGLQPKKEPGEFRVIHDLSYPPGKSVNAGIPKDLSSVKYQSVTDAIRLILKIGPHAWLAKTDIKSAFRIIPINPSDFHLLGFKWRGQYFYDKCLPMGAASSCAIFERFSTFLHWVIASKIPGVGVVHVLDDFLFIAPSYQSCQHALALFLEVCQDIGVPIAQEKTMGPSQILPFLGIQLDTVKLMASLPQDKVTKTIDLIDQFIKSKSVTLRQMQSLCGILNFSCSVIVPARAFSRRLYDLCVGKTKPFSRILVSQQSKLDLLVWRHFLIHYNYQTFMLDFKWLSSDQLHLATDASSTIGYGAVFGRSWISGNWSPDCIGKNIALLELYPIVLSFYVWGKYMSNKCITLHCDNRSVVDIINSNTSKDPTIMILIRKFVLYIMNNNIYVRAVHISGISNTIPDLFSRDQVVKALRLAPHLERSPTATPPEWSLARWLKG